MNEEESMDSIEEYLSSEQAREDVRALLNTEPDREGGRGRWHATSSPLASWVERQEGAWRRVERLSPDTGFGVLGCYYRPDGDRFVVSDLGEGSKALRLRTGEPHEAARVGDVPEELYGLGSYSSGVWTDSATAADLPDALCRVLLASYQVARLGVGA